MEERQVTPGYMYPDTGSAKALHDQSLCSDLSDRHTCLAEITPAALCCRALQVVHNLADNPRGGGNVHAAPRIHLAGMHCCFQKEHREQS
jgi:hypothetical protein